MLNIVPLKHADSDPSVPSSFLSSINLEELKKYACSIKGTATCDLGESCMIGGFSILYEIAFPPEVTANNENRAHDESTRWLARFPLPNVVEPQAAMDATMLATVSAVKYIKQHVTKGILKDLVPEVFGYALKDDPANKVGQSFFLMDRKNGKTVGKFHSLSDDSSKIERQVRNFHSQLAAVLLELASTRFPCIGTLKYDQKTDTYNVDPFITTYTCSPAVRSRAYQSLPEKLKGPYHTTSAWYRAMTELNYQHVRQQLAEEIAEQNGPEVKTDVIQALEAKARESMAAYLVLNKIGEELLKKENVKPFENGPFTLYHDDLSWDNILVDEECNITGIIDFPGTVVPITSVLAYPYMFQVPPENQPTNFTYRHLASKELFLESLLVQYSEAYSAEDKAISPTTIELLMKNESNENNTVPSTASSDTRDDYEIAIYGPFEEWMLPPLFKATFGREYNREEEFESVRSEAQRMLKLGKTPEN